MSTFSNFNVVQYKIGTTALNSSIIWHTSQTIRQNVDTLMTAINKSTVTTDVSASIWYSNNATGTIYLKLQYGQPGNWNGQALSCYVGGTLSVAIGQQPKRALGYGTAKGNDIVGLKRYELKNHLNNVLAVVSDRKWGVDDGVYNTTTGIKTSSTADGLTDYYTSIVTSYSDYDPFGTVQDLRKTNESSYRFGFQGQERDDEIKGGGNSYNYEYRMDDPRIGRFFAVDPLAGKYSFYSPYAFSGNIVINATELEGLEPDIKFESPGSQYFIGDRNTLDEKLYNEGFQKYTGNGSVLIGILGSARIIQIAAQLYGFSIIGEQINETDRYHEAVASGDKEGATRHKLNMVALGPATALSMLGEFAVAISRAVNAKPTTLPEVEVTNKATAVENNTLVDADYKGNPWVAEETTPVTPTKTAIGRMEDLKKYELNPEVDTWHKSGRIPTEGEQPVTWNENKNWLQKRIDRGDEFIISTDPKTLPKVVGGYIPGKPNGYFTARELDYLQKNGAKITYDF